MHENVTLSSLDLDMSCELLEYTGVCSMGVAECKEKVKKSDRMMSESCCCLFVCLFVLISRSNSTMAVHNIDS